MGAVAIGALLFALLLLTVAVLTWQGARRSADTTVEYLVDEAADHVHGRLEPATRERLTVKEVRLILEWQLHFQQVIAPRGGPVRPVVGSGEAMEYVLERAAESGRSFDSVDVAEVMAAEVEYLLHIGAVGTPVEGDP